ncbi:MAG: hypothetical protein QOJ08_1931 [Ilumatobacteraceae bacterium]|jgi:hypothetical protein
MSDESEPTGSTDEELTPDELELETYDLDGDGEIGVIDHERARLGLLDARLEEISEEGGLKGSLAEAAHRVVDKFDNDEPAGDQD